MNFIKITTRQKREYIVNADAVSYLELLSTETGRLHFSMGQHPVDDLDKQSVEKIKKLAK